MRWLAAILLLLPGSALAAEADSIALANGVTLLDSAEEALLARSPAEAVSLYSRALNGPALPQSDLVSSYNNRAVALRRLGQFARAAADYNRAIALAPEDPDLLFNRALALLPDGRLEEAAAELTTLLEARPDDAQALYLRGVAEIGQNHMDRAIEDLTAAIGVSGATGGGAPPEAYVARGRAYATLQQHDLALEDFEAALALAPDYGPALFGRAYSHSGLGRQDLAARDYSAAIALLPQDPAPYRGRADTYRRMGRHDLAIADYSRAIALAPNDSESFSGRALARQKLGQYDLAIVDFGQAIRLDPRATTAYKERGSLRFYLNQFPEAARDFQRSLRLNPHDAYAVLWLYLARERSGIDGRAELAHYANGLAPTRWPGPVVALFLGDASQAEVLETMRHEDERRQRERECEAFFYLGEYHLLQGDSELAARFFRKSELAGITNFMEHAGAKAELKKLAL